MFSILHISDLHRSQDEPLDNDSLIAALLVDCDRYMGETPIVPSPDAIIISGDFIQGAPLGDPNWQEMIADQYRVAGIFLDQLTQRFLDGDRSKLIIAPGNHDVCWNTSLASMERVPQPEYPTNVREALIQHNSNYRWSWQDLALYRIRDNDGYGRRMNPYWDFAESFYADVPLLQPIDRRRGFQLFELKDRQIVVAAFDSVNQNDCFSYAGAIPPGVVGQCHLALRDIPHSYSLRIAVWHHSIHGPPLRDDYMAVGEVHQMAGLQFQLGIHGHQHVAATTTHYVHLSETQSMGVVSAGSLCAGHHELPRGVNRQYNLIVIEDDLRRARVHVREMVEGNQFSRKTNGQFPQGFAELVLQPNTNIIGRIIDAHQENITRAILQAEESFHNRDWRRAIDLLRGVDLSRNLYARNIVIQAAFNDQDWELVATTIIQPQSTNEAVLLVSALIRTNALDQATLILGDNIEIDAATRRELEGQIETKRMMRNE